MAINKSYQYKISSSSGQYLGLLQNVTSDFNYNQTINSAGTQIQISVALNADTIGQQVDAITDEIGNPITDESNNNLLIERQIEPIGSGNASNLIQNNNQIQVIEISKYYPNGIVVFTGYISKWKASFGGSNNVLITCINNGQDLGNYIIQTGNSAVQSQATDNGTALELVNDNGGKGFTYKAQVQNFTAASTFSIGGINLEFSCTEAGTLYVWLYSGVAPSIVSGVSSIAGGSIYFNSASSKAINTITFPIPTTLTNGSHYWFWVAWHPDSGGGTAAYTYANSTITTNGNSYPLLFAGTYDFLASANNADLYFSLLAHGTGTTASYTGQDASYILTDVMTNYTSKGGLVSVPKIILNPLVQQLNNGNTLTNGYWGDAVNQLFTPTANMTINLVQLYLGTGGGSKTMSISIIKGDPSLDSAVVISGGWTYTFGGSNTSVASSGNVTFSNVVPAVTTFPLSAPVTLLAGQKYYIHYENGQGGWGNLIWKGASSGDTIPDTQVGHLYQSIATINNAGANPTYSSSYPAIYFTLAYLYPVPANLTGGYLSTGVSVTYTFKLNTVLEGIQQVYNLGPSNWYWYVDPATNILYYQSKNSVADITLIKGKHVNTLDVEATKEGIINDIFFSGGDDGTSTQTNVLTEDTDATSLANNRRGLARISDNRVSYALLGNSLSSAKATAHALAQAYIQKNNIETYITNVTVQDGTMDTSLLQLGKVIGFSGWGGLIDTLLLLVVGINKQPDQVTLQLGSLPKATASQVQLLLNQITALQTGLSNATPS